MLSFSQGWDLYLIVMLVEDLCVVKVRSYFLYRAVVLDLQQEYSPFFWFVARFFGSDPDFWRLPVQMDTCLLDYYSSVFEADFYFQLGFSCFFWQGDVDFFGF